MMFSDSCFSANPELFYFLQLPACSSILPGIRCGPDPAEQPKPRPTSGMRPPCSSVPACAADQNSAGPHYAAPGVPGSPWCPWGSSFRDAPGPRNRRQEICCKHRAWCSDHYGGKFRPHFSESNDCRSTDIWERCFELVSFSWFCPPKKSGRLRHHKPQRERLLLAVIVAVQPSGNHRNKPTPLWIAHR